MQCKVIAKHNTSVSKHAFFFQYTTVIMTIFLINRKAFSKIENGHPLHLLQKKALRIVANQDYIAHSEPICKALNLVKVPDMYTCAVWNFYYKLMNNLLPSYFENCKPTLPRIDQLYNVRKPVFHLPKIKHKFAEQLPDYQLVKLLNKNGSFRISSKVFTHSKKGFSSYVKNIIIETYEV